MVYNMKNKLNESKGITLIALIITIIILLILAGIIIGSISNSGLIDHSRDATQKYKKAQVDESEALQYMEQEIDKSIEQSEKEISEGAVIKSLKYLCTEVEEFLDTLYNCTDMNKERKCIKDMIDIIEERFKDR